METRQDIAPICDRSEEREATVVCQECGKALRGDGKGAVLCQECLDIVHGATGKTASSHTVMPTSDPQVNDAVELLTEELSKAAESCRGTLSHIDRLRQQMEANYVGAHERVRAAMSELRSLLDCKETELLGKVEECRETKLSAFLQQQETYCAMEAEASKLAAEVGVSEEEALQGLQGRSAALLASLSSPFPPHSSHITAHAGLGFTPNIRDTMIQALGVCMWVSGEEVKVGERMGVSAVGGLQPDGSFWVRQVHADSSVLWQQELALTHISNSLFEVSQTSEPLTECFLGQLCVAQFSEDGRWYRAVVQSIPRPGMAKFFFLDHGGSEDGPVSSLRPLPDQFRALPFQMIHVKLTTDPSVEFNTREMRWKFTDSTHKKSLQAEVLTVCEVDTAGPVFLIKLEDHSQDEPFNVGQLLIATANAKQTKSQFRSRDVRFKDQPPSSTTPSQNSQPTPSQNSQPTPSQNSQPTPSQNSPPSQPTPSQSPPSQNSPSPEPPAPPTHLPPSQTSPPEHLPPSQTSPPEHLPPSQTSPPEHLPPSQTSPPEHLPPSQTSPPEHLPPSQTSPPEHLPPSQTSPPTHLPPSQTSPPTHLPPSQTSPPEHLPPSQTSPPTHLPPSQTSPPTHLPPSQTSPPEHLPPSQTSPPAHLPPSQTSPPTHLPPSHSDAIPADSSLDTIPPDSSPDSVPPDSAPEPIPQMSSLDSIPRDDSPDTIPRVASTGQHIRPLQLKEAEGVLLSNQAPPTSETFFEEDLPEGDIDSLHPSVKTGARLSVLVATDLSPDGTFWCQLLFPEAEVAAAPGESRGGDRGLYVRLQEELQAIPGRGDGDMFTPVFYSEGDVCAACFSEDEEWYRARIEEVRPGSPYIQFTVRYLDFGNSEDRLHYHLMVLGSKFKLIPPQAIHCSIATSEHAEFSAAEQKKFDVISGHEDITAEVLEVLESGVVRVKLLLTAPDQQTFDLTDEIYSSDASIVVPSINFYQKMGQKVIGRLWSSSNDMETQNTAHVEDWASHMEDQEEEPVFLTLPGHESSRETTPIRREGTPSRREATPTSQRAATPTIQGTASTTSTKSAAPQREATPTSQRAATPTIQGTASTTSTKSAAPQREATPTVQGTMSTKSATPQREATPTQQETSPIKQDPASTQWVPLQSKEVASTFLQRVVQDTRPSGTGRQARLDVTRAKQSIFANLGVKSVPHTTPAPHTTPTPQSSHHDESGDGHSRERSHFRNSRLDKNQRKLYVKHMPRGTTKSEIRELFGHYGDVINIDYHYGDSTKLYLIVDAKGAEEAVTNLDGHEIEPGLRLVVEKYRNLPSRSPSPPSSVSPAASMESLPTTDYIRLFVKNISTDLDPSSLKSVFGRYGQVLMIKSDPKRRNVAYIYMDMEGGAKAINNLHGKAISKMGKPLIVELSHEPKIR